MQDQIIYAVSLGWGAVNWLGALPAVFTIDKWGRRTLLLATFPCMAICLMVTAGGFCMPKGMAQNVVVATSTYIFCVFYSPGAGPVPFTYSAEVYPLELRAFGMSIATATTWLFNFILAFTWPRLRESWTQPGAFSWYAGWNVVGFFLVLFFVPETKEKTLEELDAVFDVSSKQMRQHGLNQLSFLWRRYVLRQKVSAPTPPSRCVEDRTPPEVTAEDKRVTVTEA